jgi:hypothetical protein
MRPKIRFKSIFKPAKLMKSLNAYQHHVLFYFGALTRMIARRSMRKGRTYKRINSKGEVVQSPKPSKPGNPPRVWVGLIKDLLYFRIREDQRDVIIGPEIYKKRKIGAFTIPLLHEVGGTAPVIHSYSKKRAMGKFPARPYMVPALGKAKLQLPRIMRQARQKFKA